MLIRHVCHFCFGFLCGCAFSVANAATRCIAEGFVPNDHDILRLHWQNSGLSEILLQLKANGSYIRIHECSGDLRQRKKWKSKFKNKYIRCYFTVGLDMFDKSMVEEPKTNQMKDALQLFAELCADKELKQTPKVVVLTKLDLFHERVKSRFEAFQAVFPEYTATPDPTEALKHVINEFKKRGGGEEVRVMALNCMDMAASPLKQELDAVPAPPLCYPATSCTT